MPPLLDTPVGVGGKIDRKTNTFINDTSTPLTSQSLAPTQNLTLTPPKPSTAAEGFQGYMGASASQLASARQQMQQSKDDFLTTILKSDSETSLQDKLYSKSVDPAEAELSDINQQIIASQHAQQREIEALGKQGALTPAQMNAQRDSINRRYISEQADLAVIQLSKQGKFDSAKRIADRAVSAMLERQKLVTEALRFNYEENRDLFNKEEQRAFESSQAERERQLNNEEYRLRAEFDQKIKQADPLYQAQLSKARADAANTSAVSLGGTLNGKPQTTAQATIEGYATRTLEADKIIGQVGSRFTGIASYAGQILPNFLKGSDRQQYEQAQRNFVNAVLRRESGAVISDEEFANARQQYFPQPGDSAEVVAQKAQNRQTVIANLYQASNKVMPATAGSIIEDESGNRYLVGQDGESLEPL